MKKLKFPQISTRCILATVLLLCAATSSPTRAADNSLRAAAIVNEDIITLYDLEQRIQLVMMSSNLPDNMETRSRMTQQILRHLIDERLQIQEAQHQHISVSQAEINSGISTIERQNNMHRGDFEALLKERGIDPETLRQQIRAEISWSTVMRRELYPDVHVGEEEIDARLESIRANLGQPEYMAAEIVLSVDNPTHEEEVRNSAVKLIDQLHQGASFSALARQFSQTGAAAGGDLGWVSQGMLDDELFAALVTLEKGTISQPIRAVDGYHILFLRDKRIAGQNFSREPTIDLGQIFLNFLPSSSAAEKEDLLLKIKDIVANNKGCEDLPAKLKRIPATEWNRPGKLTPSQLPPEVDALVSKLNPGEASPPLDTEGTRRMFVVCGRSEPNNTGIPTREEVRQRLENERMEIMAKSLLRNLRRGAFVELRI